MQYRSLGKSGLKVSEIGYGAWGIGGSGWLGAKDEESIEALNHAIDLGLTFIDTALAYGNGHSESLIGKVVKKRSERIVVASKIPPKNRVWPARPGTPLRDAFPRDYIVESVEKSLKNLGLDTIDIMQLHVWSDEWAADPEWQEAVRALKDQGKIRLFGISINDHQPVNAVEVCSRGGVDTVQVIYNIWDQSPEDRLFPVCLEKKIGVIVRVPLDEGGLTGNITADSTFPDGDFRNKYFGGDRKRQVFERAGKLKALLGAEARTLPELALRFCLHHPAVSTVIPGMRTASNAKANSGVSDGRPLSNAMLVKLKAERWERNFYG
jgi:aryl-alcohol dehydrogenase-like predicted oxidoreductase